MSPSQIKGFSNMNPRAAYIVYSGNTAWLALGKSFKR